MTANTVLGYRERLTSLSGGGRQHVLHPVWTLIPKFEAAPLQVWHRWCACHHRAEH